MNRRHRHRQAGEQVFGFSKEGVGCLFHQVQCSELRRPLPGQACGQEHVLPLSPTELRLTLFAFPTIRLRRQVLNATGKFMLGIRWLPTHCYLISKGADLLKPDNHTRLSRIIT